MARRDLTLLATRLSHLHFETNALRHWIITRKYEGQLIMIMDSKAIFRSP